MISAVKKIRTQSVMESPGLATLREGLISWVVRRIKCINIRNVLSLEPARE